MVFFYVETLSSGAVLKASSMYLESLQYMFLCYVMLYLCNVDMQGDARLSPDACYPGSLWFPYSGFTSCDLVHLSVGGIYTR